MRTQRVFGRSLSATRAVVENLEMRRLLSAAVEPVVGDIRETAWMEWQGQQTEVEKGEWIVSLERPRATCDEDGTFLRSNIQWAGPSDKAPELQNALDALGAGLKFKCYAGSKDIFAIEAPTDIEYATLARLLSKLDKFVSVSPNAVIKADATPNDLNSNQYGLHNTGQTGGTVDADIDAPDAWNKSVGYSGTVVAVIDTGIDYNHQDLAGNRWTNTGEISGNGLDDDSNGYIDDYYGYDFINNDSNPMDDNSHGTHVAGIIGAVGNNTTGIAGVAWDVSLMALKVLDSQGSGNVLFGITAMQYTEMMRERGANVRVANCSFGVGTNVSGFESAIANAGDAGILVVAAAGNEGEDNDSVPHYPSNYPVTPGLPDNVIAVASTDHNDALAWDSNYGDERVDLAAPGVNIFSTLPGNSYGYKSGTSMATPFVSGVAALAFSVNPNSDWSTVKSAILTGVDAKSNLSGIVSTGGRLNANNTLALLSPASLIVNGDLSGLPTNDTIVIRPSGSNIEVVINGASTFIPSATVTGIAVNGLGGDDTISIDPAINIATTLNGGSGNDTITGGAAADSISGGPGLDVLTGYTGYDTLNGNGGNDSLNGLGGNDLLNGGEGDDTLNGGGGADIFNGGNGIDTADYAYRTTTQVITLDTLANDGESGEGDNVGGANNDVENVLGGSGSDTITGNDFANVFYGGGGNDILNGLLGNDTLYGDSGADSLTGGAGNDLLGGGADSDTVRGGGNDDFVSGAAGNDYVYGGEGNDTVAGGAGLDWLFGDAGNDFFNAQDGEKDTLEGGLGYDVLSNYDAGLDVLSDVLPG